MRLQKTILYVLGMILLISFALASGSIETGSVFPLSVELCGPDLQYTEITASQIFNKENITLESVTALLNFDQDPGLSFITPQAVNLGNISALAYAETEPSWTIQCSSPIQGIYVAYIDYVSENGYVGSSFEEAYTTITVISVDSFTGNISISEQILEEEDVILISDSTPTIKVSTSRDSICKGSLNLDESYDDMDFIFYGTGILHNYTFISEIPDGQHAVYVRCKDELDNIMEDSIKIFFEIDTQIPIISVLSPQNLVVGDFTEIKVKVNKEAECRLSETDVLFESMKRFDIKNGYEFSSQRLDLRERTYNYYIRCRDTAGNIASELINFKVDIPPKAEIVFEKEPPITIGTYEITLIPSKTLRSTPELTYEWETENNEIYKREVNLVKSGSYYKGFIIIKNEAIPRTAKFNFKGFDLNGNEGTEITKGGAFLVDTIPPIAPKDVAVSSSEKGILIDWYYDGESPDYFNIYRSTSQKVGLIHIYDKSNVQWYLDDDLVSNQIYYYRIAAVDKAGNVGSLSNEVSIYAKSGVSAEQAVQENKDPPTPQTMEWKNTLEKTIETIIIDLDWAENNLRDLESKEKAVEEISFLKKVLDAQKEIEKLKIQIEGLESQRITDAEMRDILSKGDAMIARLRKTVPQDIEVMKSTSLRQPLSASDIKLASEEYLNFKKANYSEHKVASYIKQMQNLNELFEVDMEIKTLMIEFLDSSSETMVYVQKRYNYNSPESLSNVIVIEIIPKTVAGDVSEIDIMTPGYEVVNSDPIISWSFDSIGFEKQTIRYAVFSNDVSESSKATKTIVLQDPLIAIGKESSMITGFSVLLSNVNNIEVFGIVIGSVIIVGLLLYYMVVVNDLDISRYSKKLTIFIPKIKKQKISLKKDLKDEKNIKSRLIRKETSVEKQFQDNVPNFSYLFNSEHPIKAMPQQYFHVKNGDVIRSIAELKDVLSQMDDFTFYYHVNSGNNDFADWVENVYHNKELGSYLKKTRTKEELLNLIDDLALQGEGN